MATDNPPAGRRPLEGDPGPARPDDNTLATRVQAAWDARLTAPSSKTVDRQMAEIAVNTILNALAESGHLV